MHGRRCLEDTKYCCHGIIVVSQAKSTHFPEIDSDAYMLAGPLNDLFELNINNLKWTELTNQVQGRPVARGGQGVSSIDGKIYMFGGSTNGINSQLIGCIS